MIKLVIAFFNLQMIKVIVSCYQFIFSEIFVVGIKNKQHALYKPLNMF